MTLNIIVTHVLFLAVFLLVYHFVYRWQNKHHYNRIFLLLGLISSLVVPFINFNMIPVVKLVSYAAGDVHWNRGTVIKVPSDTSWFLSTYFVGVVLSFCYLLYRFYYVISFLSRFQFQRQKNFLIAESNSTKSFSFFRRIVVEDVNDNFILSHEKLHAQKWHSLDVILAELGCVLAWFNPLMYLLRFFIKENHEYEADQHTRIKLKMNTQTFAEELISKIKHQYNSHLINSFNQILKNRLRILTKAQKNATMKYLLVIPLFLLLISSFTVKTYEVYQSDGSRLPLDTIPKYMTLTDTIRSTVEKIDIVETQVDIEEYIKNLDANAQTFMRIDTIIAFDYDIRKETCEEHIYELPKALYSIYLKLGFREQTEFAKKYGKYTIRICKRN